MGGENDGIGAQPVSERSGTVGGVGAGFCGDLSGVESGRDAVAINGRKGE